MTLQHAETELRNDLLCVYDPAEASILADLVMEHITGISKMNRRLSISEIRMTGLQVQAMEHIKNRLLTHEPLQYVLGEAWFLNRPFKVNEHVLIPRPETEELVEWVAEIAGQLPADFSLMDVGTGSGCIAVSLQLLFPHASISAVDISDDALTIARENAAAYKAQVAFNQMDFTASSAWSGLPAFDIIASNPPYIPWKEKDLLDAHVAKWEPATALFVPDNDALLFYRLLAIFGKRHLKKNGSVMVECHQQFAIATQELFIQHGYITTLKKDISGNYRMIKATAV